MSRSRRGTRHALPAVVGALLTLWAPIQVATQALTVGDPLEDYFRLLEITGRAPVGSFTVRPLRLERSLAAVTGDDHPWADRLPRVGPSEGDGVRLAWTDAALRNFVNSDFPMGSNDGAVWQGKGLTTVLDGGARAAWRGLSVSLRPRLIFAQNAGFELAPVTVAGMPEYAYPWRNLDLPQRFGPDPIWTLDPGQSEVRVAGRGAAVGFGTTSLWWGPSLRNAITMSNNAPGVPHWFLGTDGPLTTRIGALEARWIFGRLEQSEWYDPAFTRTDRYVTGLALAYSPSFLPGLSVGLTRVFYALVPADGVPLGDYFAVFQGIQKEGLATPENPTGDDEHDQMLSLFGRWSLPESGFEVFAEWARDDHSWDLRDFLTQPEYSQAYTLGLQKGTPLRGDRLLALRAELTHLERDLSFIIRRGNPVYYQHHIVRQGYTQRGQVIGAGIGPGSNAQYVGADLYDWWGRFGLYIQREARDSDAYRDWALANDLGECCQDVAFHNGAHGLLFLPGGFELQAGFMLTYQLNRNFGNRKDAVNVNMSLAGAWRPS